MSKMKVLELFSGLGSFSVALNSLNIPYELIGYSEIRDDIVDIFCDIHNQNPKDNLGDVHNINGTALNPDMITFGSPCQSFSKENNKKGNQDKRGAVKGGDTKSSLMWEAVRIIGECKPKFAIWENVPDAINKKHFENFNNYLNEMDSLGYNTYYKILNSFELGSAQKRKRLFSISIRKDIDNGKFSFIENKKEPKIVNDYLEYPTNPIFPLKHVEEKIVLERNDNNFKIVNGTKLGFLIAENGDCVDLNYANSKSRRGRVQKKACHTIVRQKSIGVFQDNILRYLTPLEHWRLQEMPEELFGYIKKYDLSERKQYDIVGGAINQYHLYCVFNSLDKAFNLRGF